MKKCKCGSIKWALKSNPDNMVTYQCLKCYATYTRSEIKKLKDKEEKSVCPFMGNLDPKKCKHENIKAGTTVDRCRDCGEFL